jgi:TolA-binding protein
MRKTLLLKNFASKTAPYEIEKLNSQIFNLEQKIKQLIAENPSYDQYVEKFKKLSRNIERLTVKHSHHKLKPSDVNGVEGKTNGILNILRNSETKLKAVEAKAKADSEEYNNLVDYV